MAEQRVLALSAPERVLARTAADQVGDTARAMSVRYSMVKYNQPRLIDRAFPLLIRIRPVVRAVLAMPRRVRFRREVLLRVFAWTYRNFNDSGIDRMPWSVFAPDIEIEQTSAMIDTAGTFRGRQGLQDLIDEVTEAFGAIRFEPQRAIELPSDRILFLLRFAAAGRGSGIDLARTVGHLFSLGKHGVTRMEIYWEEAEALEAAGLSE